METLRDQFLSGYTTFGIGGRAARLLFPTERELRDAVRLVKAERNVLRLGAGSKLLVRDKGFDGTVVSTARLDRIAFLDGAVWAGAGVKLPHLAIECAKRGLSGLEWACGIPASVGGAVCMNASCFGHSLADRATSVDVLNLTDGRDFVLSAEDCAFCYHGSVFRKRSELFVTGATLALTPAPLEAILSAMQDYRARRRAVQPMGLRSAGSAWQRVGTEGAGRFVDRAGLKGFRIGQAQISPVHANFIVNLGAASCKDVAKLLEYTYGVVREQFGVRLVTDYVEV